LAAPVADTLSAPTADLPQGDAVLFEAGGAYLLEALRHGQAQLAAGTRRFLWTLLLLGATGLVPLCAVLVALSHQGRLRAAGWSRLTARHLPSFIILAGLTLLAQAVVLLGAVLVVVATRDALHQAFSPRGADFVAMATAGLGAALVVALGVVQDLARAAVVRHEVGGRVALAIAFGTLRRRPGRILLDWLTPTIYTLPTIVGAALVANWLGVEREGAWRVALVFVVHQIAAFGLVALRSWWLGRALVLVSTTAPPEASEEPSAGSAAIRLERPPPADRPAGSGA